MLASGGFGRGGAGVGEDDFLAGVEALDLADLVPGLAGGAAGAVVVRSQSVNGVWLLRVVMLKERGCPPLAARLGSRMG